jgi:hypothetical protein
MVRPRGGLLDQHGAPARRATRSAWCARAAGYSISKVRSQGELLDQLQRALRGPAEQHASGPRTAFMLVE